MENQNGKPPHEIKLKPKYGPNKVGMKIKKNTFAVMHVITKPGAIAASVFYAVKAEAKQKKLNDEAKNRMKLYWKIFIDENPRAKHGLDFFTGGQNECNDEQIRLCAEVSLIDI